VNLRRNPKMTCLFEAGEYYEELRGRRTRRDGRDHRGPRAHGGRSASTCSAATTASTTTSWRPSSRRCCTSGCGPPGGGAHGELGPPQARPPPTRPAPGPRGLSGALRDRPAIGAPRDAWSALSSTPPTTPRSRACRTSAPLRCSSAPSPTAWSRSRPLRFTGAIVTGGASGARPRQAEWVIHTSFDLAEHTPASPWS